MPVKQKIESALRRAVEELPQPDYQAVTQAPVQRMEIHDYITRQEAVVRPSHRRFAAAAALILCALALGVGLTIYFQFFQIYSVVDLRVNPSFAIQLNRQDQVRSIQALNEEASPILEGRSYRGWTLAAVVGALVDAEYSAYLTLNAPSLYALIPYGAQVDVAVNSKSAEHGRELRIYVEGLLEQKLAGLPATVAPEPQTDNVPQGQSPTPAVTQSASAGLPRGENGLLTWEAVEALAQVQTPGAQITELQLDEDDGKLIYEVKYRDSNWFEYEMDLDAVSGEILKWERE